MLATVSEAEALLLPSSDRVSLHQLSRLSSSLEQLLLRGDEYRDEMPIFEQPVTTMRSLRQRLVTIIADSNSVLSGLPAFDFRNCDTWYNAND
jgi:hypothetical protein